MSDAANRRASWGLALLSLFLAGHYLGWGGEYGLSDVRELRSQRAAVAERVDSLRTVLDSLTVWGDSLEHDPAVIERIAREEHAFIRPGERLYLFVPETGDPDPSQP